MFWMRAKRQYYQLPDGAREVFVCRGAALAGGQVQRRDRGKRAESRASPAAADGREPVYHQWFRPEILQRDLIQYGGRAGCRVQLSEREGIRRGDHTKVSVGL